LSSATFLRHRQDQRRALLVAPAGTGQRDGSASLLFDFKQRSLSEYRAADWMDDGPEAPGRDLATATQQARARVPLNDRQKVTAAAFLPPVPPRQMPLLALAYDERGEPTLRLYNAATGETLRQFNGHLGTIRR